MVDSKEIEQHIDEYINLFCHKLERILQASNEVLSERMK